jgi:hypothetical protein
MSTSETLIMKTKAMTSSEGKNLRRVAACGLVGMMALGGCDLLMQKPRCPELSSCGGPIPSGSWQLMPGHGSCTEDIAVPPTDLRLPAGVVPAARTPGPEPALYDWCDQLITKVYDDKMGILAMDPNFYTPDIQVGIAAVTYIPNTAQPTTGTYTAGIGRTGTFQLVFPVLCMREFGASGLNPAVDKNAGAPVGPPVGLCKQLELPLSQDAHGGGALPDVNCDDDQDPNDQGGCVCTFTANMEGGGAGSFVALDDHTLLNLPGKDFPQKVTYCNTGGELQLTGGDGEYLFGTLGLRTLDLVPMK